MKKPSTVFFGSGPVAAKALELLSKHQTIEAVITKPVPVHHKEEAPVQKLSDKLGLKTYYPVNRQGLTELFQTISFSSRVGVVIDYGIIIAPDVIDCFELGIINSHFSLLPRWRGADPISFAILEGDKKTGVSLMVIDEQLDTGKLIAQRSLPISSNDTTRSLTNKLVLLSDELLTAYLPLYVKGNVKPRSQPHTDRATHSRKLTKEDGFIDWSKSAEVLEREIRAFIDWPKSRAVLASKDCIVTEASVVPRLLDAGLPGQVHIDPKIAAILVDTKEDTLAITRLKPAGKKEMTAREFIAGYGKLLQGKEQPD